MTAARLPALRAGPRSARPSPDPAPSPQRSALALFGFVLPCAIGLAVAVGGAADRPLVLAFAVALSVLLVVYLRYGTPGPRGWWLLAVSVPLTLAVSTLAMSTDAGVLFPLLFTSVCWTALTLRTGQVVANVGVTIGVSALPWGARLLGWESGNPAEGVGLLLVSAAGFTLVGVVVPRLVAALRRDRQVSDGEAFARSAGIIGEFLYSGELHADERFVVTARGPGLAALLGASAETQLLLDEYDECVHPDDRPGYDLPGASATCGDATARSSSRSTGCSVSTEPCAGSAIALR